MSTKISQLTGASVLTGPEVVAGVQSGNSRKILASQLSTFAGSIDTAFLQSGTGAVARTIQNKNRDFISVKDFGVVGDDITDDYTNFVVTYTAAVASGQGMLIPSGTYKLGTNWVISSGGIRVKAVGKVILHFTNTGKAVSIDGGVGAAIYDVQFGDKDNPIHIKGNANTTDAVYIRAAHHCDVNVNVRDCVTGLRQEFAVLNKLNVICSVNEGAFVLTPTSGIILDRRGVGEDSAACEIYPIIEGVSGTGIVGTHADFCIIRGGSSEGNSKGLTFSSGSRANTIIGTDFESNSSSDVEDAGTSTIYQNVNSISTGSGANIQLTGAGATFYGGILRQVDVGAGSFDTSFYGVGFSSAVGITSTGPYKRVGCYTVDTSSARNGSLTDVVGESSVWTPALASAGGGTQGATTTAVGTYYRVGKMIHVTGNISIAKGTLGAGGLSVTGLPFQARSTANALQGLTVQRWESIALTATYDHIGIIISPSGTSGTLQASGISGASISVTVAMCPDPITFVLSGTYETI